MRLLYPTGKDCQEIYLKYFIFFKIFTKPEMPPPALSSQGRHFRFLGYFYEDDENLALSVKALRLCQLPQRGSQDIYEGSFSSVPSTSGPSSLMLSSCVMASSVTALSGMIKVKLSCLLYWLASSEPYQDHVRKIDRSLLEAWRRSFFLVFFIMIANSPGDLERYVNCSAEKREQQYDLFKRHAASPLSALERSGGAYFQEKNLPISGHSGAGKEQPPAFWTTKRFCALQLILPTKSPPSRRVRGRVYRKNAYSTMKVQVAAGRTRSPAAAVTGAISGRVLFSPRTRSLPLQRMVWLRRVSADSW